MTYVLASSSPRRKELMKEISSSFIIDVSNVDESVPSHLTPVEAVTEIAKRKGEVIKIRHPNDIVISADTIVVINHQIIGKPIDEEDAKRMLHLLSDKTHVVYTAYFIFYKDQTLHDVVATEVDFNKLDETLINEYVASGSPLDKAGGYGFQDNKKYPIVKGIRGSINNVIGFPVEEINETLKLLKI